MNNTIFKFKLAASYNSELNYYTMASSYVIQPGLFYWCNDRPIRIDKCLALVPNLNGTGSCILSDSCDNNYAALCEAVCK